MTTETPAPPRLAVQVGAFALYDNARQLRDRLEAAGFTPIYIQSVPSDSGGGSLYRVRIGPVESVAQGDQTVADVGRQGVGEALLVVE